MISWLWGGAGASKPPPLSPALQEAQAILGEKVADSFSDDQALARSALGLTSDQVSLIPTLIRHLGAAVRAQGEEQGDGPTTISSDAVVLAAAAAMRTPSDWAFSVLAAGTDDTIPLATVEAVLRNLLSLVVDGDGGDAAARALALGWAAAQAAEEAGGGMGAGAVASSSSPLTRAGFKAWAKKGSGVAVADCLAGLLRGLGEHEQEEQEQRRPAVRRFFPAAPQLLPPDNEGTAPLLLTPATALALAPHVPDPRRRDRWHLIYCSARHGKSWSSLCGRLRAAGAAAAQAVEARADAAALAAAAAGGGGARGRAAARAAAVAPISARDEDAGPPATLVLVRDGGGAVFGGAAFAAWQRRPSFYGGDASSSAFLFALSPALRVHHASGINANAQFFSGAGPPFQSLPNGLGMGGQLGAFGLFVDAKLERGHSRPNATFACAPLCSPPGQDFDVAEVEVWALLTPDEEEVVEEEGAPRGGGRGGGGGGGSTVLDRAAETRAFMQVAGLAADHSAGVRD
jgi:hypothetical protein